jgi:two-component system, chemotaxis family, chemotaxis protein CheY
LVEGLERSSARRSVYMPKSILIVDDAVLMRRLLRNLFAGAGYDVHEAVSGRDAIEAYAELRPDLVTMDIGMPGMSGLDAIAQIRDGDASARIVVVSAAASDEVADTATSLGAIAYIRKPFQPAALLDAVRKALLVPPASRC